MRHLSLQSLCTLLGATLLVAPLLRAHPAFAQNQAAAPAPAGTTLAPPLVAPYDAVELSLGSASQKARIHIVDFGDIPAGQPQ